MTVYPFGPKIAKVITDNSEEVTLKQYAMGTYVNGRYVEGSVTESSIRVNVQPANGEDIKELSEGRRMESTIRIYSTARLETVEQNSHSPDRIIWQSDEYEVKRVWNWEHYTKALAVRVGQ
jgi:hypothetical protein